MIRAVLFDWGNTLMRDCPEQSGPMSAWEVVEAMPNAESCLQRISSRVPCFLATNARDSSKADICTALRRVRLHSYISDIFCFRETGQLKPDAGYFAWICEKLQLDAGEIMLVGDDLATDYRGATAAGLAAVLYDPAGKHPDIEHRISDLSQLSLAMFH
ncbi:HAD family hydrolase [Spirochaeta africana]|uniref:Haloacid dehalogenase superfamily enzyme, subfamily IA n=1 Tax=Spirochaeta africana (strain ATCC 700263 / DSM 8902 / Z-7692) TaxID=889378 RepID=H9UIG9_SPIAZ|nr:HAD family hydrolase [Spirochaeta africana]AFG37312.1 haloacid dehalogenase superfamily enzyme, subfamily IA [Spirochaeta africana DSM 8902]